MIVGILWEIYLWSVTPESVFVKKDNDTRITVLRSEKRRPLADLGIM
jgi:hypothetical protein